jgi:aarF domain-containing kinase
MLMRRTGYTVPAVAVAAVAAALGLATYANSAENSKARGFRRTLTLWSGIGPVIAHYRLVEAKLKLFPPASKDDELQAYKTLDDLYADRVLDTLRDLRGFYIKVGQLIAHRSDIVSKAYVERLRTLEDKVPPLLDESAIKTRVAQSLGIASCDDVFSDFDTVPVGSASIGQVHRATLKRRVEGIKTVAVKVQSPGSEDLFRTDIKTARDFCRIFAPEQLIIFDEIEKQFLTEFDYRQEAARLNQMRENMACFKDVLVVPKALTHLCSKEVSFKYLYTFTL